MQPSKEEYTDRKKYGSPGWRLGTYILTYPPRPLCDIMPQEGLVILCSLVLVSGPLPNLDMSIPSIFFSTVLCHVVYGLPDVLFLAGYQS